MKGRKRIWLIWGVIVAVMLSGAYAITSRNASNAGGDAPAGYVH
jgi:hypothetical protein